MVAVFALKLESQSLTSPEGADVVAGLVKLRVVLEKIGPLETKLKYQIDKLVRKADQAAEGGDEEEVVNGECRHCGFRRGRVAYPLRARGRGLT